VTARVLAVDGGYLARSSFEAGSLLRGSVARLLRLIDTYLPRLCVVAWDSVASQRREWEPSYKEQRREARAAWDAAKQYRDELWELRAHLPALGITQAAAEGWEGDDVLATIARTWPGPIVLWSPDHDLLPLLAPGVLIDRGKHDLLTAESLERVTGLSPSQHLDAASLTGCQGDGVPGLQGIGQERARRLIAACPRLIELLESEDGDAIRADVLAADPKMARYAEQVIAGREAVRATRRLVSLYTVELEIEPAAPDCAAAARWLDDIGLEFEARRYAA